MVGTGLGFQRSGLNSINRSLKEISPLSRMKRGVGAKPSGTLIVRQSITGLAPNHFRVVATTGNAAREVRDMKPRRRVDPIRLQRLGGELGR
jgi:hypothetical protein